MRRWPMPGSETDLPKSANMVNSIVAAFADRLTANTNWLDSPQALAMSPDNRWCEFTFRNKRIWDEAEKAGVHHDVARVLVPLVK